MKNDDSDRRQFFRQMLGKALDPLAGAIEKRRRRQGPEAIYATSANPLRPPGAIAEASFPDTCQRCRACVRVCPASAILPSVDGTPYVDPDRMACVVCDGLQCTHVCPSGALLPLSDPLQISMGLAETYPSLCLRLAGEECTVCVERCPIGEKALTFREKSAAPTVGGDCTGCGVCQQVCPTQPKAIVVTPRRK